MPHPAPNQGRLRLILLFCLLIIIPTLTVAVGPAAVPVADLIGIIAQHLGLPIEPTWDQISEAIVIDTRLPRIVTGTGVGAVLGVTGVALQTIVRNPLAEPYVLGVSSGASAGAATAMIIFSTTSALGVAGFAFAGALAATMTVVALGSRAQGSALTLILAGLGVGFACQAITNLIIFAAKTPEASRAVLFWTLGSLSRSTWPNALLICGIAAAITAILIFVSPILDALGTGDQTAMTIGIQPQRARIWLLIPVSAAVALAVAVAGGIGFVGLIIPHLIRSWISTSHKPLLLGSALGGAIFLTATDAVARVAFSPSELPLGVITGLIGAPFLLILILKQSRP